MDILLRLLETCLCKLWENLARMFPVCWVWPFEVFLKCVIDTLSMDLLPFLLLAQQIQMLHILCGTDALSQRIMENNFVSQAGVSNIVFYTSTANDTTQQEWLYLTLSALYFTLFYCVFRERESTQCCHPAPHTFIWTQQPYRQRCSKVKVGTSKLLVSLKWFCCSWNQEKYLKRKPVQLFSCVNK